MLNLAQQRQDSGRPWGDALAYARAAAAGVLTQGDWLDFESIRDEVRPFLPEGYIDPVTAS